MKLQISSQVLREQDAVAYYDEATRICYFGIRTASYCGSLASGMIPDLEMITHILNHEIMHDVLNIHFGREVSLQLDNVTRRGLQ